MVSHVEAIAQGLKQLIEQVAGDVPVTFAGGSEDDGVGTSFEAVNQAIIDNEADEILAFYDLGSAKMNLELAIESSDKSIDLFDVAFIEGVYTAASLLQADAPTSAIKEELDQLIVK
ncbi:PTS-dependent dihydroxyacetone kinase, phosphotransferase subunit dhaM [Alloiococcus otitis]|uniref:phosphoenolpyruvate--glycerone phosphotransferase n=2 Tax=Alloiococcus TaxID=1651 RepID=K9EET2_9LACT|nr:dihydroxyacetone kinase, phosphotransfer subunit [Alloiococcus otitis ATCC 51267]SUU81319.1 PTS-dependent dihydroxyacetone kinase, phosphotransferase subunit dhaM [Alloiococcus otitis]